MMKKLLIGLGIVALMVVIFFTLSPLRLFVTLTLQNQDSVASREYQQAVKFFNSTEITGKDDLLDRFDIVNTYFEDANTSNLYNGNKIDITSDQMVTLFNEPGETIAPVDLAQGDTVYQYQIDNTTLNFHAKDDIIEAVYLEEVSGVKYDSQQLDAIFLSAVNNNLKESSQATNYTQDDYSGLVDGADPTRKVYQNGWHYPYFNNQFYYDDNQSSYSPEEYVLLNFKTSDNANHLESMYRRYRQPFTQLDSQTDNAENEAKWTRLLEEFNIENIKNNDYYIKDLEELLGDIYQLRYDFKSQELTVSWYFSQEGNRTNEVRAIVAINENTPLESKAHLSSLKITYLDTPARQSSYSHITSNSYIAR